MIKLIVPFIIFEITVIFGIPCPFGSNAYSGQGYSHKNVPIDGVEIPAGRITERWSCENCPSGTYFIRLNANEYNQTRKMTLVK